MIATVQDAIDRSGPPPKRPIEVQLLKSSWALACKLRRVPNFVETATAAVLSNVFRQWFERYEFDLGGNMAFELIEEEFHSAWEKLMSGKATFVFDDVIQWAEQQAQETDELRDFSHPLRVLGLTCRRLQQLADRESGRPGTPFHLSQESAAEAMDQYTRNGRPEGGAGKNGLRKLERMGTIERKSRGVAWSKRESGEEPKKPQAATFVYIGDGKTPDSEKAF